MDTLEARHARGREITSYILSVARRGRIGTADAEPLARAMDGMVRMYRPHAAREDTVVFPAWKASLTPEQLRERAEEFEDIEHEQFGEDGFEEARDTIEEERYSRRASNSRMISTSSPTKPLSTP